MSVTVRNVAELARRLHEGDRSVIELLVESGYLEAASSVTREALIECLEAEPTLLDHWLRYSANKRTPDGWFLSNASRRTLWAFWKSTWSVRRFRRFPRYRGDPFEACARFIQLEVEDLARRLAE